MRYIMAALAGVMSGIMVFLLAGWMCGFENVAYSLLAVCCGLAALYVVTYAVFHASRFIRWARS